jgi:hypothetical protein
MPAHSETTVSMEERSGGRKEIYVNDLHSGLNRTRMRDLARPSSLRGLIDRAMGLGGSYYLTDHRFARRDQVEACHPQIGEFLRAKRRLDPELRFQSDWWHHHECLPNP